MKRFLLILCLFSSSFGLFAQGNFPVTAQPVFGSSGSLNWSDFYTSNDFLKVSLRLKDNLQTNVPVFLRFKLERVGVIIQSRADYVPAAPVTTLGFGVPVTLTGPELIDMFRPENLQATGEGISPALLRQGGKLPEGFYTLTVTAFEFDAARGNRQVSNTGMTLLTVFKGYPPLITYPQDGQVLPEMGVQNVLFQWLPRSAASRGGFGGMSYQVSLYDLGSGSNNANFSLDTRQPIISPTILSTTATNFPYGPGFGHTALVPGNRYAVRVQVVDIAGGNSYYNDGYSEVVSFTYGQPCVPPVGLTAQDAGSKTYRLNWEQQAGAKWYEVSYQQNEDDATLTEELSYFNRITLAKGTQSPTEFRVRSVCANSRRSGWSDPLTYPAPVLAVKKGGKTTNSEKFSPDEAKLTAIDGEAPPTLEDILNPYDIPVSSEEITQTQIDTYYDEIKNLQATEPDPIRCGAAVINAVDCAVTPHTYSGDVPFTPFPKSLIYINGYEVMVSRGSAAAGEGLLYLPYVNGRIPVAWQGLSIKESEDVGTDGNHYGCVTAGEVIAQGSNGSVLTQDLNRQLMTLMTDGPGSFSGKFGEAIELMKELATKMKNGETISIEDFGKFKSACKAVKKGTKQWIDEIETTFGKPSNLPEVNDLYASVDEVSTKLTDILNCGSSGYRWEMNNGIKNGPSSPEFYATDPCQTLSAEAAALAAQLTDQLDLPTKIIKTADETEPLTIQTIVNKAITLSNGQKVVFGADVTSITRAPSDPNVMVMTLANGQTKNFVPLTSPSGRFTDFYECIGSPRVFLNSDDSSIPDPDRHIHDNAETAGSTTSFYPFLPSQVISPNLYEIDRTGNKFYEFLTAENAALATANKELVAQIDDLIEEMVSEATFEEFVKNPFLDKGTASITTQDLINFKNLLEDYKTAQQHAFQSSGSDFFDKIWKIIKECWNTPNENSACTVNPGILPRCWWDYPNAGVGGVIHPGLVAGIIDGVAEGVTGVYQVLNFTTCWTPNLLALTEECKNTRVQTREALAGFGEIIDKEGWTGLASDLGSVISTEFSGWIDEIVASQPGLNDNCRAYHAGKLIFDVGSLFIGAGEIKAGTKGINMIQRVKSALTASKAALGKLASNTRRVGVKMGEAIADVTVNGVKWKKFPIIFNEVAVQGANGSVYLLKNGVELSYPVLNLKGRNPIGRVLSNTEKQLAKTATKVDDILTKSPVIINDKVLDEAADIVVHEFEDLGKIKYVFSKKVPKPSGGYNLKPLALVAVVGAVIEEVTELTDELLDDDPCTICTEREPSAVLCKKLEQLAARGNNTPAVEKLCTNIVNEARLEAIVSKLLLTFTDSEITEFLGDINCQNNIVDAPNNSRSVCNFVNNLTISIIDAWKICNQARPNSAGLRLDWDVLEAVASYQTSGSVKTTLTIDGEDKFLKMLKSTTNYVGVCNTCQPSTSPACDRLPYIHVYLKSLRDFAVKYGSKTGFNNFITGEATSSGNTKHDGAYHLMRHLNGGSVSASSVLSFEQTIKSRMPTPGTICDCVYDVERSGNMLSEYKSFGCNTAVNNEDQFKQYLQYWSDVANQERDFQYIFNSEKIDHENAKKKFVTLLKSDPIGFYNINPSFFNRITGVQTAGDFEAELIKTDFWQNNIFNFVTIVP